MNESQVKELSSKVSHDLSDIFNFHAKQMQHSDLDRKHYLSSIFKGMAIFVAHAIDLVCQDELKNGFVEQFTGDVTEILGVLKFIKDNKDAY